MPAKNPWQTDTNHLNNAGLDVIHPVDQVDKDHYSRMEDVKSLQEGCITPRPGTSLINATALASTVFSALTSEENSGEDCLLVVSGAANAFGANTEFVASTAFAVKWITLTIGPVSDPDIGEFEFEIRTGADPGVKVVTFVTTSDASGGIKNTDSGVLSFPVPEIAAGTRITMVLKDLLTDTGKDRCFTMNLYG